MNKQINLILSIFSLVLFVSCNYQKLEKEAPEINLVKVNESFRINLPENHSKGETWQLKKDFNPQFIYELPAVWHGNEKGIDFNLKALASSQNTLCFVKRMFQDTLETRLFIVKIAEEE
jgi:hypothetical protein